MTQPSTPPLTPPSPDSLAGFETFGEANLETAARECRRWLADLKAGRHPRWLTLLGTSGTGKTHLARALWLHAKRVLQPDPAVCCYSPRALYWPELIDDIRAGLCRDLLRDARRWPVAFIDDVGAERTTDNSAEALAVLLGCRSERWTILTANLPASEISRRIDARIADRMLRHGGTILELRTVSYSLRKRTA